MMNPVLENTGYATTLKACREHIEDAAAAVDAIHTIINSFADFYVDVPGDVFCRRAVVSHEQFTSLFTIAASFLHDASGLLRTAKALSVGADMIIASSDTAVANAVNPDVEVN